MGMLEGKAVIVTGAGRGLGAAFARDAASHGAAVVVNDLDADVAEDVAGQIRAAGGTAIAEPADVRSAADCQRLIQRSVTEFGKLDGLVNNAGVFLMDRIYEQDEASLRVMLETNVLGTFLCASAAVGQMLIQGSGSIINITSGARSGIALMGAYAATKGAVAAAVCAWSAELAGTGVRVNAVSPQARTRMSTYTVDYLQSHGLPMYPGQQPEPEANAPAVTFLLSDAAAAVTGQVIRIEGPQLSLMTNPAVLLPLLTDSSWSAEKVAAAFERDLAARQQPVGIRGTRSVTEGLASAFWSAEPAAH